MNNLEPNSWSMSQIREGKAILFLGNGATLGAVTSDGHSAPTSEQLRNLLSDTFLGGEKKESALAVVSDYANSMSSLQSVQAVIREQFVDLQPALFHSIIPRFRWRAIFTTNFDLVIERAY